MIKADTVNPAKPDGVVYRIPSECGKVYIGETGRPTQERTTELDKNMQPIRTQTSVVSEHAHETSHIRLHPNNISRNSGTAFMCDDISPVKITTKPRFDYAKCKFYHEPIPKAVKMKRIPT